MSICQTIFRINELEGQVSDLQAEASKLIEALENHKTHSEKEKTSSNDKFTEIKTLYDNSVCNFLIYFDIMVCSY